MNGNIYWRISTYKLEWLEFGGTNQKVANIIYVQDPKTQNLSVELDTHLILLLQSLLDTKLLDQQKDWHKIILPLPFGLKNYVWSSSMCSFALDPATN